MTNLSDAECGRFYKIMARNSGYTDLVFWTKRMESEIEKLPKAYTKLPAILREQIAQRTHRENS